MTPPESQAGITYAELGIDTSRCHGGDHCKTLCPKCSGQRKNRHDKSLSVDLANGRWRCHNPGCDWRSGLVLEAREAGRTPMMTPSTSQPPIAASTPSNRSDSGTQEKVITIPSDTLHDWAARWLDDRGIPRDVAEHFRITSSDTKGTQVIHLPYFEGDELTGVKHRTLEHPKRFWQDRKRASLYNINAFRDESYETAIIVEGEMDVLACYAAGWKNVLSVSDGAGTSATDSRLTALDSPLAKTILDSVKRIVIAVDTDAAGITYRNALVEKFGALKCYSVTWPEGTKDANEVLIRDGAEALSNAIAHARPADIPGIYSFHDDIPKLLEVYDAGYSSGASTGWPTFDQFYQVFPGTVTLIAGIPGHGKTTWLTHLLSNLIYLHGWGVGLFSPEMGSHLSVLRKFTQVCADSPILPGAEHRLPKEAIEHSARWVADRVHRVDAVRTEGENFTALTLEELLDRFAQLVIRNNIKVAVIDPWIRVDAMRPKGLTESEWVAVALNKITRWAQRHQVAFIIVNHPRKQETGKTGEDEGWVSPYEVIGSAYWFALADFIIAVKRNKYEDPRDHTFVRTWKVREERVQGNLGICEFTFDPRSERFYDVNTPHPIGVGENAYTDLPSELRALVPMAASSPVPSAFSFSEPTSWEEPDWDDMEPPF